MNLILLEPADFLAADRVVLRGRRHAHVRDVHRAAIDASLRVGLVDGAIGTATVVALDDDHLELVVRLDAAPPPPHPATLVVAMPRPHSLRKVLQQATAMGVKQVHLFNCARVEQSYFGAGAAKPAEIAEELRLGLEQARDTILPTVTVHPHKFHRFLADAWPGLSAEPAATLLAHPEPGAAACPRGAAGPVTLVVGPEGGLLPAEVARLRERATAIDLGPRILRVETAVVALLARLSPW